jgi:hypothetical protein
MSTSQSASSSLWTPPAGTLGLDRSAAIAANAQALVGLGYQFAIRTVGINPPTSGNGGLTQSEVSAVLGAGMAIGIYQMLNTNKNAIGSSGQGTMDAQAFLTQVQALDAPPGMTLWYDFEVNYSCGGPTMQQYLNNWAAKIVSDGYLAGLYVGGETIVSTTTLSDLPDFHAYWMAAAAISNPTGIARGYQMYQLLPYYTGTPGTILADGINIDGDVVQKDNEGDLPVFWKAS